MFFADLRELFPTLYTKRLTLRGPRLSDVEDIFDICSKDYSCRYADWYPHKSKRETRQYIAWLKKGAGNDFNGTYTWFAELKETGRVIATISITETDRSGLIATIGYTLAFQHQHKGLATEAVAAVISYLFKKRFVKRVQAKVMPENLSSMALLERLGLKREGLIKKGAYCKTDAVDIYIYGITDDEFKINGKLNSFEAETKL